MKNVAEFTKNQMTNAVGLHGKKVGDNTLQGVDTRLKVII